MRVSGQKLLLVLAVAMVCLHQVVGQDQGAKIKLEDEPPWGTGEESSDQNSQQAAPQAGSAWSWFSSQGLRRQADNASASSDDNATAGQGVFQKLCQACLLDSGSSRHFVGKIQETKRRRRMRLKKSRKDLCATGRNTTQKRTRCSRQKSRARTGTREILR